jgi:2-dehydro-3-deoxygluconokinase
MSQAPEVVLIGEALMVLNGPADRPVDRGALLQATFAGAESNVAIGLARLGHQARWLSVVGDDLFGSIIVRTLRGEGVDVACVQTSTKAPTAMMVKSRRAGGEPEVFYYRRGSAISQADAKTFPKSDWEGARVLYISGITPALSPTCREMMRQTIGEAHRAGIETWIDPNHRRKLWSDVEAKKTMLELLPMASVALVGLSEGQMLTGFEDAEAIAGAMLKAGVTRVIVKTGTSGALYHDAQQSVKAPAFAIDRMIDPIGAGDGFAAGVLSARLEGLDWPGALRRGNAMGAIVCLTQGDWEGLPTRRELEDFMSQRRECVR